jgi:hypothetical protein
MIKLTCKIDSHIPTEDGLACECGYFLQNRRGDDYIKHVRDTVSNFANYKKDLLQIVVEDVPHEHQTRLLVALDVNTKHNWDNIKIVKEIPQFEGTLEQLSTLIKK